MTDRVGEYLSVTFTVPLNYEHSGKKFHSSEHDNTRTIAMDIIDGLRTALRDERAFISHSTKRNGGSYVHTFYSRGEFTQENLDKVRVFVNKFCEDLEDPQVVCTVDYSDKFPLGDLAFKLLH